MYEDKRKLLPSGLLSQATAPTYAPSKIVFDRPAGIKQANDKIFQNKEKLESDRRYAEQQAQQAQQADSGGMTIICTRCHELGFMPDDVFAADEKYGDFILEDYPEFMAWYLKNARPIVARMHYETLASRLFTKTLWYLFVKPWSEQMAFESAAIGKGNRFGKWLMKTGYNAFLMTSNKAHSVIQSP